MSYIHSPLLMNDKILDVSSKELADLGKELKEAIFAKNEEAIKELVGKEIFPDLPPEGLFGRDHLINLAQLSNQSRIVTLLTGQQETLEPKNSNSTHLNVNELASDQSKPENNEARERNANKQSSPISPKKRLLLETAIKNNEFQQIETILTDPSEVEKSSLFDLIKLWLSEIGEEEGDAVFAFKMIFKLLWAKLVHFCSTTQ